MRMISKLVTWIPLVMAVSLLGAAAGRPPIVDAARTGNKDALRTLLQKGANVNEAEGDGTTALHWASYKDDLQIADALIKAGANVNAANDLGATPLWTASQNGSEAMVKRLLDSGARPNMALPSGETSLMVASRTGTPAVVALLLAKGANANARGSRDQTALMWAVAQKHPEVVKVLLSHGADVHARSATWTDVEAVPPHGNLEYNKAIPHGGDTALMFASLAGDVASARLLVAAGANVNDADAWGVSATTLAAHSNFEEMVEFLLDKGADASAAKAGFSALHVGIMHRSVRTVRALLEHGADPNAPLKTWTPTRRSSRDFNFPPELVGASPYWLAARTNEPELMRLLLKHGADPKVIVRVTYAPDGGRTEGISNSRTYVTTAVMAATGMGGGSEWVPITTGREKLMLETVRIAMEAGADVNIANTDGRTALDAARSLKYESVVKALEENGAKPGTGGQSRGQRGTTR